MAPEYERNSEDAVTVIDEMDNYNPDRTYSKAVFGVHNGFCLNSASYQDVDNLREEDYFLHTHEFHSYLDRTLDDDTAFNVVYRSRSKDKVFSYLGGKTEQIDETIESSFQSGFIVEESQQRKLGECLSRVEDGGKLVLCDEINGLCGSQFEDLIREVDRKAQKDLEILRKFSFPDRPLDRTHGTLHWERDTPEYLKVMESSSVI